VSSCCRCFPKVSQARFCRQYEANNERAGGGSEVIASTAGPNTVKSMPGLRRRQTSEREEKKRRLLALPELGGGWGGVEVIHSQNKPVRPRSSSPSTGVTSRLGGLSISLKGGQALRAPGHCRGALGPRDTYFVSQVYWEI